MTGQILDALFLPLALAGITLVLLLALSLRNTAQLAILNRRQRLLFDLIEAGGVGAAAPAAEPAAAEPSPIPAAPPAAARPDETPPPVAEPAAPRRVRPSRRGGRVSTPPVLAAPATADEAMPAGDVVPVGPRPIEPITVRTDSDLGVVYSFRGKDYLSRVAADQARWRALNQSDGIAHARASAIHGPAHRADD